ncbi:hypothetical protein CMO86_08235 [Candidatus Woesearchaeota archaeon]|jgi:hypothetical protein|nr:hypothetical protein [Candidatus Woesearchaeota archaeon]|tara:strand:+ start:1237 stop:1434 length:198 start_codon:yes stop_codon:yes gene_type:complete
MAKYSRFDPRNKRKGRHKAHDQQKDFRIKNTDKMKKNYLLSPSNVVELDYNEGETNEQSKQSYPN